jgi:5-methylcytosine-specific restriction protein A
MALKTCITCGTPTRGSRCPAHARGGSTRAWRNVRAEILYDAAYRCAICGRGAAEVDHIVPVIDGGSDHPSNLRALCHDCHARRR